MLQATEKRQKDKTDTALSSRTEKRLKENTSKLQAYLSAEKH